MSQAHACTTLTVHCMDFRFIQGLRAWMAQRGTLGTSDVIAVPGVAKVLVDPQMPEDADFLLRAMGIAVNLHRVQRVVLVNHLDCGTYGGSRAFGTPALEEERHRDDLRKAADLIRERFPHVAVELAIASLGDGDAVTVHVVDHLEQSDRPAVP